jgi:flagellin-like protein
MNRRAVSPVIATLLMIAIAVASGTLVYVWSMGIVGTLQSPGGQQTKQQLIMEAYKATGTATSSIWTLNLRNPGSATLTVAAVYVNGEKCDLPASAFTLVPSDAKALLVTIKSDLVQGVGYPVKIVTVDGAVFTFTVIAGRSE